MQSGTVQIRLRDLIHAVVAVLLGFITNILSTMAIPSNTDVRWPWLLGFGALAVVVAIVFYLVSDPLVAHYVTARNRRKRDGDPAHKMVGVWWEIQSGHPQLSVSVIEVEYDDLTNSVSLDGWGYDADGNEMARFRSTAGVLSSDRREFFYRWDGNLLSHPDFDRSGVGTMKFSFMRKGPFLKGMGHYMEFAAPGRGTQLVQVKLERFTEDEESLWNREQRRERAAGGAKLISRLAGIWNRVRQKSTTPAGSATTGGAAKSIQSLVAARIKDIQAHHRGSEKPSDPDLSWHTELIRFNWHDVYLAARKILSRAESEFQPDVVVCVNEISGLFVAMASHEIARDIPFLLAMWVDDPDKSRDDLSRNGCGANGSGIETKLSVVRGLTGELFLDPIRLDHAALLLPRAIEHFKQSKVLVIEDRCRTGSTQATIRGALRNLGFKHVRFAVPWVNAGIAERKVVEYFHFVAKDDVPLEVPWGRLD